MLKLLSSSSPAAAFFDIFLVVYTARTRVIGTIISVLVSLTMVANARAVLFPAALLHDAPAATTELVSLIAVPAHMPKPVSERPSRCPRGGKMKTAMILNRNIVEMA